MYSVITVYSAYGEINVMITELNIMGHRAKIWITGSKNVKKNQAAINSSSLAWCAMSEVYCAWGRLLFK